MRATFMVALAVLLVHVLTNGRYGFHRDELAVLDDARELAWGYIAYPPLTPLLGRAALELFGTSLVGLRFFAALAQSLSIVLVGLMVGRLGGGRRARLVAAFAAAIAPMAIIMGALFQYISFDYLWWVLVAYLVVRLLESEDPRWWLGVGAAIGLTALGVGAVFSGALMLPIAPIGSTWWRSVARIHDNFAEEIGWPDLVETVAAVYASEPEGQRAGVGILTGNYGEAGAIDLYGPAFGLPKALSGTNSYWLRGYGRTPPRSLIVIGFSRREAESRFSGCEPAARVTNRYGVTNQETRDHPDIFRCQGPREPWPLFWSRFRRFG